MKSIASTKATQRVTFAIGIIANDGYSQANNVRTDGLRDSERGVMRWQRKIGCWRYTY